MENNKGDNYYVDLDSIKYTSADIVRMLQKVEPKDSSRYAYMISQQEINCKEKKIRMLKVTSYDKKGKGRISQKNDKWQDVRPEDIDELLLELVCSLKKPGN